MGYLLTDAYASAINWWYGEPVKAAEVKKKGDDANKEGQEGVEGAVKNVAEEALNKARQQMTKEMPQFEWTVDGVTRYSYALKDRSIEYYRSMTSGKESKNKAQALAKTVFDSVSIYFGFWGTVGGGLLAWWSPEGMKDICQMVDRLIARSIKDWTFDKRMIAMGSCTGAIVAASYLWVPIVPMVCTIYTVKIGGDLYFLSERFFDDKTR